LKHYWLEAHLRLIRDYLHFGRGDFANVLIEALSQVLSKPASSLFRHSLVGGLDAAVSSLPNGELSELLRAHLDLRLHETTTAQKLLGWDVFTLDYKAPFPLDTVLSGSVISEHLRLSHFLWSLRRVLYALQSSWHRLLALQPSRELALDMKRLLLLVQEGSCLARQLSAHSLSLVHRCWERFLRELDSDSSAGLDYILDCQSRFLADLREELFIWSNSAIKPKLAALLSSLLKVEPVMASYTRYISLSQEHLKRSNSSRSMSWSAEDETLLDAFGTNQLRLLTDCRASFQQTARLFQGDFDEFHLVLQKELACQGLKPNALNALLLCIDHNGYHRGRNGFDHQKYSK